MGAAPISLHRRKPPPWVAQILVAHTRVVTRSVRGHAALLLLDRRVPVGACAKIASLPCSKQCLCRLWDEARCAMRLNACSTDGVRRLFENQQSACAIAHIEGTTARCHATGCGATQRSAMGRNAMQRNAMRGNAADCAVQRSAMQFSAARRNAAQRNP